MKTKILLFFFAFAVSLHAGNYTIGTNYRSGGAIIVRFDIRTEPTAGAGKQAIIQDLQTHDNVLVNLFVLWGAPVNDWSGATLFGQWMNVSPPSGVHTLQLWGQYQNSDSSFSAWKMIAELPLDPMKVRISYFNKQGYDIQLKIVGNNTGTVITQAPVAAHTGFIQEFELPAGDTDAIVLVMVTGASWDGVQWLQVQGAITPIRAATVPGSTATPTPTTPVAQPGGMPALPTGDPTNPGGGAGGPALPNDPPKRPTPDKPLWAPDPETPTESKPDVDRLDKKTFREGVEKLHEQSALAVDELKQMNERAAAGDKAAKDAESALAAKISAEQTKAMNEFNAAIGAPPTFDLSAQGSGNFQLNLYGLGTVNLDPLSSEGPFSEAVAWIKGVIAFLVAGWLTYFCYSELQTYMLFGSLVGPAKGNTVAGSGGQITSAIVAFWITVVLVSAPTAIAAIWQNAPLLTGLTAVNPFQGAGTHSAQALYLLYGFLPIPTILIACTTAMLMKKAGTALYVGIAAAIRWAIVCLAVGFALGHAPESHAEVLFQNMTADSYEVFSPVPNTLSAGGNVSVPYVDSRFVLSGAGQSRTLSVLDYSIVTVENGGVVSVEGTPATYAELFAKGFFLGMSFELFGVMLRVVGGLTRTRPE